MSENLRMKKLSENYWKLAESIFGFNEDIDSYLLLSDDQNNEKQLSEYSLKTENSALNLQIMDLYKNRSQVGLINLPDELMIEVNNKILAEDFEEATRITNKAIQKYGSYRELMDLKDILEKKSIVVQKLKLESELVIPNDNNQHRKKFKDKLMIDSKSSSISEASKISFRSIYSDNDLSICSSEMNFSNNKSSLVKSYDQTERLSSTVDRESANSHLKSSKLSFEINTSASDEELDDSSTLSNASWTESNDLSKISKQQIESNKGFSSYDDDENDDYEDKTLENSENNSSDYLSIKKNITKYNNNTQSQIKDINKNKDQNYLTKNEMGIKKKKRYKIDNKNKSTGKADSDGYDKEKEDQDYSEDVDETESRNKIKDEEDDNESEDDDDCEDSNENDDEESEEGSNENEKDIVNDDDDDHDDDDNDDDDSDDDDNDDDDSDDDDNDDDDSDYDNDDDDSENSDDNSDTNEVNEDEDEETNDNAEDNCNKIENKYVKSEQKHNKFNKDYFYNMYKNTNKKL